MFMPNPMILTIKLFFLNSQKHFFYRSPSVSRKMERCCSILNRFQKKIHFCYQNNILHKTRGSFDESENVTLYSLLLIFFYWYIFKFEPSSTSQHYSDTLEAVASHLTLISHRREKQTIYLP